MFSSIRIIKFAWQDIMRNFSLSFMTVLILVLMLLSLNTMIIVNVLTGEAIQAVNKQIDVSLYFANNATEDDINEIKKVVQSFPEVVEIKYLNRDEVLANFRAEHRDNAEIIASLDELGENPLGPTMVVRTRAPEDYEKIIKAVSVPEYEEIIEAKTFADTKVVIDRIQTITTQVKRFTSGITILFTIIAFLIIFNTIRVAIYTQRIEISIKKLVGATNWFVRGPYVVESLLFSVISTLVTTGIMIGAIYFIDPYVSTVFSQSGILFNYYYSNIFILSLIQFGAVLAITMLSSLLAMRKYLRT